MFEVVPLFPTCFGIDTLNLDNDRIADYCKRVQKVSSRATQENGWQSEYLNVDDPDEEVSLLFSTIQDRLNVLASSDIMNFKDIYKLKLYGPWININCPGVSKLHSTQPHCHRGIFSGVYYVSAEPDCGQITLLSPISAQVENAIPEDIRVQTTHWCATNWRFKPSPGMLIMFPSWLMHYVTSDNRTTKDRISIAFNSVINDNFPIDDFGGKGLKLSFGG